MAHATFDEQYSNTQESKTSKSSEQKSKLPSRARNLAAYMSIRHAMAATVAYTTRSATYCNAVVALCRGSSVTSSIKSCCYSKPRFTCSMVRSITTTLALVMYASSSCCLLS